MKSSPTTEKDPRISKTIKASLLALFGPGAVVLVLKLIFYILGCPWSPFVSGFLGVAAYVVGIFSLLFFLTDVWDWGWDWDFYL